MLQTILFMFSMLIVSSLARDSCSGLANGFYCVDSSQYAWCYGLPSPAYMPCPSSLTCACGFTALNPCTWQNTKPADCQQDPGTIWNEGSSDQCPSDPNKNSPGVCGCGVPDTDTDNDGVPDCNDGCPQDPRKTQPGKCGCGVAEDSCDTPTPPGPCSFDISRKSNAIAFWGQDVSEGRLSVLCDDSLVDAIVIEYTLYAQNSPAILDLGGHCWTTSTDDPSSLYCPEIEQDIRYCQQKGKKVLLSVSGGAYPSTWDASQFAQTIRDSFFGGSSTKRPFGTAVFDGLVIDPSAGSATLHSSFLRAFISASGSPTPLIGAVVSGCGFGDSNVGPGSGTALGDARVDFVVARFYDGNGNQRNCALDSNTVGSFNSWNSWARTAQNTNTKVYLGFSSNSASSVQQYIDSLYSSSNLGGVAGKNWAGSKVGSDNVSQYLRSKDSSRQNC